MMRTQKINVKRCTLQHTDEVTKIWRAYHKELTGSDYIGYDEHGNLFGFIAELQPMFQSEILEILYEAGYKAGIRRNNKKTAQAFAVPEQLSAIYGAEIH